MTKIKNICIRKSCHYSVANENEIESIKWIGGDLYCVMHLQAQARERIIAHIPGRDIAQKMLDLLTKLM